MAESPNLISAIERVEGMRSNESLKYHGVAALLADQGYDLPPAAMSHVRAQAMWEMRHKIELTKLLDSFEQKGIESMILKGTALAYAYYKSAHHRSRGDTDVLVRTTAIEQARAALLEQGFSMSAAESSTYQEGWFKRTPDRALHVIDLHWQVLNGAAVEEVLPSEECFAASVGLPRLSHQARTLPPAYLLVHACLHRLMHRTAPYFIGEKRYLGGDRLIWAVDIQLLCDALQPGDQEQLVDLAREQGVANMVTDGLRFAERTVSLALPPDLAQRLAELKTEPKLDQFFLNAGRRERAWRNVMAGRRWTTRMRDAIRMLIPEASGVRARYPNMRRWPLPILYLRRILGFAIDRRPSA